MNTRKGFLKAQEGQSIVLIAIVLVGLLAIAGLAIDGGNLFLQRRRVQNAADAGAMAGTRVLARLIATCEDGDSADDALVDQAVTEFVTGNGFSEVDGSAIVAWYVNKNNELLGQVGSGSIPATATGVYVGIDARIRTFFMPVVGIESSQVGAEATGMTGRITQFPGGILPIAVPLPIVEALEPGEDFVVLDNGDGSFCQDANGNGQYDPGLDICIGDPANPNANRGWLNLNYIYNTEYIAQSSPFYRTFERNVPNRDCGPDPAISTDDGLQGWAGDGCPYPFPIFAGDVGTGGGDFIHGDPGARQSSLQTVVETYNGRTAYVPIFDFIYTSDYMDENFPDPEGIDWPRAGGGGQAYLYHIVGYTAVHVDDPNSHDHELGGEFIEAVIGNGVIQPGMGLGAGACRPSLVYGVNLWE